MTAASQFSLPFEPGLTARFRTLEDVCQQVVLTSRIGVDGVAAHLDMQPSELSRRLNAHHAAKEGDSSNRPLRISDLIGIMQATNDFRPIYWLAEKFLGDPDAQRTAAMQQIAMLTPILVGLAEQAGLDMPKAKARAR
ncbi:MAG TPA: hypothetical protein VLH12_08410 [Usitatibacter sp.]|nr:hypothetical protein [Usitatibacter sp.]